MQNNFNTFRLEIKDIKARAIAYENKKKGKRVYNKRKRIREMKMEDLISEFKIIPDYRKGNAVRHNLEDILMIVLPASICNNGTFYEMELFERHHEKELKKFLELPNGIPSHDTFGEVFSKLDRKNLKKILDIWIKLLKDNLNANTIIAIDGKTVRGSRKANKKPKHIISAFATESKVFLGQLSVEKNE